MAKVRVYQPQESHLEEVKNYIDIQEENPTTEVLNNWYSVVMDFQENQLPLSDEELLIGSIESMVNVSQTKLRDFGEYDVIQVENKGKSYKLLMLPDDEYEVIED